MNYILIKDLSTIQNYQKLIFRRGKFFLSFNKIINNLKTLMASNQDIYLGSLFDYLSFEDYSFIQKIIAKDITKRNYYFLTKYPEKFEHLIKEKIIGSNYRHYRITFSEMNKLNSFKKGIPCQIISEKDLSLDLIVYQYYLNEFVKKLAKNKPINFVEIKD